MIIGTYILIGDILLLSIYYYYTFIKAIEEVRQIMDPSIQFYAFDVGIENHADILIGIISMDALLETSSDGHGSI